MPDNIRGAVFPKQFSERLFESAPDGMVLADATDRIVRANASACRMLCRTEENLKQLHVEDIVDASDGRFAALVKDGRERGWANGEATLIRADGSRFAAMLTATEFRDERNELVRVCVVRDLSAVKRLQAELQGIVESIGALVAARDPYTAGHERRVALIAERIGRQLKLPAEQLEGLRITGFIHDVGKIAVPAEILSKPGRLHEVEFALIKRHPQTGYEVLKSIDFRWPVAQAVLQHHERLDGSGYPQGLEGDSILLDARIIAVADVVETMASHRPYRPSLGIDAALLEIERGQGSVYDARVVDACLDLFRTGRYQLPP